MTGKAVNTELEKVYLSAINKYMKDQKHNFEYAVGMHSLLEKNMQDRNILTREQLLNVASQLAELHAAVEASTRDSYYGSEEHIQFLIQQNFDQIYPFLSEEKDRRQLAVLEKWATDSFAELLPLIRSRKAQGFIRACHGDPYLDNMPIFQDRDTQLDGIEFNENYHWCDTMADLGFLAMNLDSRSPEKYSSTVVNHYMEISGDFQGAGLLNFYKSYSAMVRARASLHRFYSDDFPGSDKMVIPDDYRHHADLAESYCTTRPPFLITMQGLGAVQFSSGLIQ